MKNFKKTSISMLLVVALLITTAVPAFASANEQILFDDLERVDNTKIVTLDEIKVIHGVVLSCFNSDKISCESDIYQHLSLFRNPTDRIFDCETEAYRLPDVIISIIYCDELDIQLPHNPTEIESFSIPPGYVAATRVIRRTFPSTGPILRGSRVGTFASISGVALGFSNNIPAMTVGAILSLVGIVAGANTSVQGETFTSYRITHKIGEGRVPAWNNSWVVGHQVGRLDVFRHVWGSYVHQATQGWRTYRHDFPTPAVVQRSRNYHQTDAWLENSARNQILHGFVIKEGPF